MTKRIFYSICTVAITVLLASLILIIGVLNDYFSVMQMDQLQLQTTLAAQAVSTEGLDFFNRLDTTGYRITWINPDGKVLYDSDVNADTMENHLQREEIREALANGSGRSMRYSTTLMERQLYAAKKLEDGTILRLSDSQYSILTLLFGIIQPIAIILLLAITLSLILAYRLSKMIIKPLNVMDLDNTESAKIYPELLPLLKRIRSQKDQLSRQAIQLQQEKDTFEAATEPMTEGLILLSNNGKVLSINRSAAKLLSSDSDCTGQDILQLENSAEMKELMQKAQRGEHSEMILQRNQRFYRFLASPVTSDQTTTGVALLILDMTEEEKSQKIRQEFTANVSHELKTPLHTISGCAELLQSGMVQQEDIPRFAGQIFSEARRMIALIEDIIRLSHLDEGAEDLPRESLDLYALSAEVLQSLAHTAKQADVTLNLQGERAVMCGIHELLRGIIFNLCDNAIKYNVQGGKVTVAVHSFPTEIVLFVQDTGIGIPEEQQERIFERFYRVDKSRSKAVGGTGLGLSIVKHAAKLHGASITLQSTPGKGTTVTVRFPKETN